MVLPTRFCVCADVFNKEDSCDSQCADPEGQFIYDCTREKGHEGPHIACGITVHQGAKWDQVLPDQAASPTLTCVSCTDPASFVIFDMCFACYQRTHSNG